MNINNFPEWSFWDFDPRRVYYSLSGLAFSLLELFQPILNITVLGLFWLARMENGVIREAALLLECTSLWDALETVPSMLQICFNACMLAPVSYTHLTLPTILLV